MKKVITAIATGGLLIAACPSAMADGNGGIFDAKNFSATATLTTDYVFRGISNTTNGPAMQGSIDWAYKGFYVGVWGSNTDAAPGESLEIDYYGGYDWSWSGLDFDISGLYYSYPGYSDAPTSFLGGNTPEYGEGHIGVSHTFSSVMFTPTVGVGYNYSPDYYGEAGDGNYTNGTLSLALPHDFTVNGMVGWQDVAGSSHTGGVGYSYGHWLIGVTKPVLGFNLNLNFQDTWHNAGACGGADICDSRVVFSISRSL